MEEQPTLEEDVRAIREHLDHAEQFVNGFLLTIAAGFVLGVALLAGLAIYEWFR